MKIPQNTHVAVNPNVISNVQATSVIRISPAASAAPIVNTSHVNATYHQPFHTAAPTECVTNAQSAVIFTTAYSNGTNIVSNPKNVNNSGSYPSWTTLLPIIDTPNKTQMATIITTFNKTDHQPIEAPPVSNGDPDGK